MKNVALALILACSAATAAGQEIRIEDPVAAIETAYEKAAAKAAACVVAIRVDREAEPAPKATPRPMIGPRMGAMFDEVFARRPSGAVCSGVVVEADGTILTTHFNVSGKVKSITVLLPDGREREAKILGYDGTYDLAVLKVDAEGLPVLPRAKLEELKAGQALVALGRAPDGRGLTVNPGIVSAASRLGGKAIQTDAKLNYGNVGGPIVDLEGKLVAVSCKVNTKYASSQGQNSGVGFAITHDRLPEVLANLKAGKNVAEVRRPFLGIEFDQKSTKPGVELASVQAGGAAEKAGVKAKDVIVEFDGKKVAHFDELREAILRKSPGDKVKLKVLRGEEELELQCELGWAPGE